MTQGMGIEPRPQWWEASALTTKATPVPLGSKDRQINW